MTLTANQSIYIPLGKVTQLTNFGTTSPKLSEVHPGRYLGAADIIRFEDLYGREI
jgi:mannose-1-phosphate guanylyltransferase/mannose-6-phosphate isomerase